MYYPNRSDWFNSFWKYHYLVNVDGWLFAVNANHEQDALDYVIDHCEKYVKHLLMIPEDVEEEEYLEDYICGGNHGRYFSCMADMVLIETLKDRHAIKEYI